MKKERTYPLSCDSARNISIVKTLATMGHFPKRQTEKEAWYLSPFRSESRASFKVFVPLNRWYDHGEGIGGNCIDLVCKIKNCSVGATLHYLESTIGHIPEPILKLSSSLLPVDQAFSRKLKINEVKTLSHPLLLKYLDKRQIPLRIAQKYCREVHYLWSGRSYYSMGLQNRSQGWELRNAYCKNGSSPKDVSLITNGRLKKLAIVEGMFDLLSLEVYLGKTISDYSIIVLNSISFLERALPILENFEKVSLYLDNDESGKKATKKIVGNHPNCMDKSNLYAGFQDLNDWIINKVK